MKNRTRYEIDRANTKINEYIYIYIYIGEIIKKFKNKIKSE